MDNLLYCRSVCERILWMYLDMTNKYHGVGPLIDYQGIDFEKHFFTYTEAEDMWGYLADLLSHGALIAMCCEGYDILFEEGEIEPFQRKVAAVAGHPLLKTMDFEREVVAALLDALSDPLANSFPLTQRGMAFKSVLQRAYDAFVVRFFETLSLAGKPKRRSLRVMGLFENLFQRRHADRYQRLPK